jgi:(2R)-sulfolactate sulfo-lyase subunit alpha
LSSNKADSNSVSGERPQFLLHQDGDSVAVAVDDLTPGRVRGASIKEGTWYEMEISHEVPLGHKFAMLDLVEGDTVLKYGIPVGVMTQPVSKGEYVHTHNVRSARWQNSRA